MDFSTISNNPIVIMSAFWPNDVYRELRASNVVIEQVFTSLCGVKGRGFLLGNKVGSVKINMSSVPELNGPESSFSLSRIERDSREFLSFHANVLPVRDIFPEGLSSKVLIIYGICEFEYFLENYSLDIDGWDFRRCLVVFPSGYLMKHLEVEKKLSDKLFKFFELKKVNIDSAVNEYFELKNTVKENTVEEINKVFDSLPGIIDKSLVDYKYINNDLLSKANELKEIIKKQNYVSSTATELKRATNQIKREVERSSRNVISQIEAYIEVKDFFSNEQRFMSFHGWPISADIASYIINLVLTEYYDFVIEFGSGSSTIIFGKALLSLNQKNTRVFSFDHNEFYAEQTRNLIREYDLGQFAEVRTRDLADWKDATGNYMHYDCDSDLAEIAEKYISSGKLKILVFIDGPPGNTCELARYPAIPKVLDVFSNHELHFLMDDYVRDDEKKAAFMWSQILEERFPQVDKKLLKFEKDAFFWACKK